MVVIYCLYMKTWNFLLSIILFLPLLTAGCTSELPYLTVTVESVYTSENISIPYSFKSEQSPQPCKIELTRTDGSSYSGEDWLREEWIEEEGTLYFENLEAGEYQLRFVVLSARGSGEEELSFLDETYTFTVTY